MAQKEPLSRPVLITGVIVPMVLGIMAILGNVLTTRLQTSPNEAVTTSSAPTENQEQTSMPPESGATDASGDISVKTGETANAFGGKVFIALIKTASEGEPARDTVYATLSSDDNGVKDWRLKGVDAGFSGFFNGFKIRVMSVETDHARFRVTPLAPTAAPEATTGPRH